MAPEVRSPPAPSRETRRRRSRVVARLERKQRHLSCPLRITLACQRACRAATAARTTIGLAGKDGGLTHLCSPPSPCPSLRTPRARGRPWPRPSEPWPC
eukprot:3245586-Pyramimonas_sp.AAC.1